MQYHIKKFPDLTTKELLEITKLRIAVFVVEQNCPYQEIDDADESALHVWLQDKNHIIGYTRIIDKGTYITFGRVAITLTYRQKNLGKNLLEKTLDIIKNKYPEQPIIIEAQEYLLPLYQSFNFDPISDVYLEDNIPHITMKKHN